METNTFNALGYRQKEKYFEREFKRPGAMLCTSPAPLGRGPSPRGRVLINSARFATGRGRLCSVYFIFRNSLAFVCLTEIPFYFACDAGAAAESLVQAGCFDPTLRISADEEQANWFLRDAYVTAANNVYRLQCLSEKRRVRDAERT